MNFSKSSSFSRPVLWGIFFLYLFFSGYVIMHHEMWIDELHSWNIAKGSVSFSDVILNTRYEGHPPLWYAMLWVVSKFTHDLFYVQLFHLFIAAAVVFILLFRSPFSLTTKLLIPFGYYFLYEYAVLSRNYAIGILFIFCVCLLLRKNLEEKYWLYYLLLLLASNTHLIALLLAVSIHAYLLMRLLAEGKKSQIFIHGLIGLIIFLPAAYFIIPPSDSQLGFSFFLQRWNVHQLTSTAQLPLRSFIPVPAWWSSHPWNTEVLIDVKANVPVLKFINPLAALSIIAVFAFILRKDRKALAVFLINIILSGIVTISFFPLTSARYSGFIFIGFLVAWWLYLYERPGSRKNELLLNAVLIIQVIAGVFFAVQDIQRPFSNAYKIKEVIRGIPPGEKLVTDYWAMNIVSAYVDKPVYCVDLQKEKAFVFWGPEMANAMKNPHRYSEGLMNFLNKEKARKVYFLSTNTLDVLNEYDPKLSLFKIKITDADENTIKKGSDLYLYEVELKDSAEIN